MNILSTTAKNLGVNCAIIKSFKAIKNNQCNITIELNDKNRKYYSLFNEGIITFYQGDQNVIVGNGKIEIISSDRNESVLKMTYETNPQIYNL